MQYFIDRWILFTYITENIDVVWNFEGVWCISIYLDLTISTNPNRFYLGIHRVKFKTSYHVCFMSHVPNTKPVMPAWLRCYEPCNGATILFYFVLEISIVNSNCKDQGRKHTNRRLKILCCLTLVVLRKVWGQICPSYRQIWQLQLQKISTPRRKLWHPLIFKFWLSDKSRVPPNGSSKNYNELDYLLG